jgi:hypothetical protein
MLKKIRNIIQLLLINKHYLRVINHYLEHILNHFYIKT